MFDSLPIRLLICGLGLPCTLALIFLGIILRMGLPPLDLYELTVDGLLDLVEREDALPLLN